MRSSRVRFTGLVVLATVATALTACTGAADRATDAPPADPKQVVMASAKGIEEGNYSFTVAGDETEAAGTVHKPSESAKASMTLGDAEFTMNRELIYVAPDLWVKVTVKAPELPTPQQGGTGKWQHIDPVLAEANENLRFDWVNSDLVGAQTIMKNVVTATKAADGSYTGTVDLSTLKGSLIIDSDLIAELGPQARQVPFQAVLDDQGRLGTLTLKLPAAADAPPADLKVSYSGYGAATATAKPPAAQAEPADDETYEIF